MKVKIKHWNSQPEADAVQSFFDLAMYSYRKRKSMSRSSKIYFW